MNTVKIIAFVGMPGAGKGLCVDFLTSKGWPSVYFGGITVDEVKARGQEVNEANERVVREELRAKEGPAVMAKRSIPKIDALAADGHGVVVVDGLYSWSEYKVLKEMYGDSLIVVAVAASRATRHQRLLNRPVRPLTEEQVTSREYAEIENIEKGGPIANADYTILNDGTPEDTRAQLDTLLSQINLG